jgi:hypothetical protein
MVWISRSGHEGPSYGNPQPIESANSAKHNGGKGRNRLTSCGWEKIRNSIHRGRLEKGVQDRGIGGITVRSLTVPDEHFPFLKCEPYLHTYLHLLRTPTTPFSKIEDRIWKSLSKSFLSLSPWQALQTQCIAASHGPLTAHMKASGRRSTCFKVAECW